MGAVTLRVGNLDTMTGYYRDGVRLEVLSAVGGTVVLGCGSIPIVILEHAPELKNASPRDAGLFHTAILFDTQEALAAAVYSVAQAQPGTFTGSADHLVSKAFYFTDPEGNGVELYWDRDRSEWSWIHGSIEMATLQLDPNAFLSEHLSHRSLETPLMSSAVVGHVHLKVGDISSAREFYVKHLGFDETATLGQQALFVSAGGYHHHLAMNTWNSAGAGPRGLALGLGRVDIQVPTLDDLGETTERLAHFGVAVRNDGASATLEDPWANQITLTPVRA
jgi:catechol 2,3-dioxygenase